MKVEIVSMLKNKKIKYPCLLESTITGSIIFFWAEGDGVILVSKGDMHVGDDINGRNMRDFKPFNGSIMLSND